MKKKISAVRWTLCVAIGVIACLGLYTLYDMRQAKHMAAAACGRAVAGLSLNDYLKNFSTGEFAVIRSSDSILLVPKKGMGRNSCTVTHDGQKILSSKTSFAD